MRDYDKNKETPCVKYWSIKSLYGWAMSGGFKWVEGTSQFDEDFIKSLKDDSDEG